MQLVGFVEALLPTGGQAPEVADVRAATEADDADREQVDGLHGSLLLKVPDMKDGVVERAVQAAQGYVPGANVQAEGGEADPWVRAPVPAFNFALGDRVTVELGNRFLPGMVAGRAYGPPMYDVVLDEENMLLSRVPEERIGPSDR